MRKFALTGLALATVLSGLAAPTLSDARQRHHYRHYANSNNCEAARHRRGANGAIIGAIGGGIVGNAVSHGNRAPGTLLGAGVGALAGHEVGRNSTRC